jgi:hypothetical protein
MFICVQRETDVVAESCKEEMNFVCSLPAMCHQDACQLKCAGSNNIYCRASYPELEPPKCFPQCTPEDCSEQVSNQFYIVIGALNLSSKSFWYFGKDMCYIISQGSMFNTRSGKVGFGTWSF